MCLGVDLSMGEILHFCSLAVNLRKPEMYGELTGWERGFFVLELQFYLSKVYGLP